MEFTPVTDQYTAAPPSMGQYSPDSVTDDTAKLIDQREYQPANPIAAQPSPPVYSKSHISHESVYVIVYVFCHESGRSIFILLKKIKKK